MFAHILAFTMASMGSDGDSTRRRVEYLFVTWLFVLSIFARVGAKAVFVVVKVSCMF